MCDLSDFGPRVPFVGEILNFPPPLLQLRIQFAGKIRLNAFRQVIRIARSEDQTGFSFDDVLSERTHISCDHRKAKTVSQKWQATLVDVRIRQDQHIGGFEVQLYFLVRDELNLFENLVLQTRTRDFTVYALPIAFISSVNLPGDYQAE